VTLPDRTLKIGFGSPPGTARASITWVDVTAWLLEPVGVDRGRSSEFDDFPPSRFSCTLDNSDRRFDPTNTAGPYYPNVLRMVPLR
jgi:hypothetical protein